MTDSIDEMPIPNDTRLKYTCACGYRDEYAHATDVTFLRHHATARQFTADCPGCESARPAKVATMTFTGSRPLTAVVTGRFETPPTTDDAGRRWFMDLQNADFEEAADPMVMLDEPFSPRCNDCNALLDADSKQANPDAPEVGWEYYECPECGERTRADVAEPTEPPTGGVPTE